VKFPCNCAKESMVGIRVNSHPFFQAEPVFVQLILWQSG